MTQSPSSGVSRGRSLAVWLICCVLAGGVFFAYVFASLAAGRGEFIMPLDDVYIHFQYAKQLALGQPYIYNPGLPPSSGATSFLYPFILAAGYLLGFQGLNLGLWAMVVGAVALACSMWLVYRLVKVFGAPEWLAVALIPIFALNGAVSWHFMSGMETGLVMLFSLWTVYAVTPPPGPLLASGEREKSRLRQFVAAATLMALIRPEGAILTLLAVGAVALTPHPPQGEGWQRRNIRTRYIVSLLLPVLAIGVQPLVNRLVTGSAVASGNAAKSVLGIVPFEWGEVIRRIAENFARLWSEFFTGISPREGMYLLPGMLVLAGVGVASMLVAARGSKPPADPKDKPTKGAGENTLSRTVSLTRNRYLLVVLVILGWLVGGTLAISTLDTAFWHFKRYQMPFMALLFPLAWWGATWMGNVGARRAVPLRYISYVVIGILLAASLWTWPPFLQHYALNGDYVYLQPLQMARWLQANTPPDAVVAVHDTGLLRYVGGRTTIDMVGLTTPGAADYWRNGPGAVAEFLMDKRPDYIAAYGPGHGFGLSMVADTDIYGKPLAEFPVTLDDRYNVALAAAYQGIYKPEWEQIEYNKATLSNQIDRDYPLQRSSKYFILSMNVDEPFLEPFVRLNLADINSERGYNYHWQNRGESAGFPTEVHQFEYALNMSTDCQEFGCPIVDGGRRINGDESFVVPFSPGDDLLLITRLHPSAAGTFDVYANEQHVATRWIPSLPGHWLDVATVIPARLQSPEPTVIRIEANVSGGYYSPYYHWVFRGRYLSDIVTGMPVVATYQGGAIELMQTRFWEPQITIPMGKLEIQFTWRTDGSAKGDYIAFVHLYDDVNQPPVAQTDIRPGGGTLPPGNWLPGVLHDIIWVDVKDVPPGKYQVAIGFYDPITFERLAPDAGGDANGRLFIGEVEIKAP